LNHQLRAALSSQEVEAQEDKLVSGPIPLKIKLDHALLDIQPDCRAGFTVQLTMSAWSFHLKLHPITALLFALEAGRIKIHILNVQVAGFNVPRAVIDRFVSELVETAADLLNQTLSQLQQAMQVQLAGIETTQDSMLL